MSKKSNFMTSLLTLVLIASSLITAEAYHVDSIPKPSPPEFTVRVVAHPYDVPPKTTTTIDQYTGKETKTTQPGYHVENKSIEIVIKNPQFTPINVTEYTPVGHYWYENYVPTPVECNYTANLYYNLRVKGHFGDEWKSVGGSSYPPQPNAQLDSKYTVISISADYPNGAVLDFQVKSLIGFYLPYGRTAVIFGYDFYGKESDWSNTQILEAGNPTTQPSTPAATVSPSPSPVQPTLNPTATPAESNTQTDTELQFSWEQIVVLVMAVVIVVLAVASVFSRKRRA